MNWKVKALIQRTIELFPQTITNNILYYFQRKYGGIKTLTPIDYLEKISEMLKYLKELDFHISDKSILEVGTGRSLNTAITLWLCGAGHIITVDSNKYLKEELVLEQLNYVCNNQKLVKQILEQVAEKSVLENRLLKLSSVNKKLDSVCKLMNIEYRAPADASALNDIISNSIDLHLSLSVLEHIPSEVLNAIMIEAKRIVKNNGLAAHIIDTSDHFAYMDKNISDINYLQLSQREWNFWGGKRLMYQNRMRSIEFEKLFQEIGCRILKKVTFTEEKDLILIKNGFPIDDKFRIFSDEINSIFRIDLVGRFVE